MKKRGWADGGGWRRRRRRTPAEPSPSQIDGRWGTKKPKMASGRHTKATFHLRSQTFQTDSFSNLRLRRREIRVSRRRLPAGPPAKAPGINLGQLRGVEGGCVSREHQAKPDREAFKQECVTARCNWDVQLMHINRPGCQRVGGREVTPQRKHMAQAFCLSQEGPLGKEDFLSIMARNA